MNSRIYVVNLILYLITIGSITIIVGGQSSERLDISALGREYQIGSLYNARIQNFLGVNVFKSSTDRLPVRSTDTSQIIEHIIPLKSIMDVYRLMDVEPDLAITFASGDTSIKGNYPFLYNAASRTPGYLNDDTLLYAKIIQNSRIIWMIPETNITDINLKLIQKFNSCTHIVTEITFGGSLVSILKFPTASGSSADILNTVGVNKIGNRIPDSIQSYSEFSIRRQLRNLSEVQEMGGQLQSLIGQSGKPIKYGLIPISSFMSYFPFAFRLPFDEYDLPDSFVGSTDTTDFSTYDAPHISTEILQEFIQTFDQISWTHRHLHRFVSELVQHKLHLTQIDLIEAQMLLSRFLAAVTNFKYDLRTQLKNVRTGRQRVSVLEDLLHEYHENKHEYSPASVNTSIDSKFTAARKTIQFYETVKARGGNYLDEGTTFDQIFDSETYDFTYILYIKNLHELTSASWINIRDTFFWLARSNNSLWVVDCGIHTVYCSRLEPPVIHKYKDGKLVSTGFKRRIVQTTTENGLNNDVKVNHTVYTTPVAYDRKLHPLTHDMQLPSKARLCLYTDDSGIPTHTLDYMFKNMERCLNISSRINLTEIPLIYKQILLTYGTCVRLHAKPDCAGLDIDFYTPNTSLFMYNVTGKLIRSISQCVLAKAKFSTTTEPPTTTATMPTSTEANTESSVSAMSIAKAEDNLSGHHTTVNFSYASATTGIPLPTSYEAKIDTESSTLDYITSTIEVKPEATLQNPISRSIKSTKNAYILLIGLSGCGKSSTLNFLFGKRYIAPVKNFFESSTDTKHIKEYIIEAPLETPGSKLHIIDTRGIGPPNGLNENADIITSLASFLNSHSELSHVKPNVVLIFTRFDDNRIGGKGSSFVQMLTTYGVIASKFLTHENSYSNAIFVLTRLLSDGRTLSRNPTPRFSTFQSAIENYTSGFPRPIVFTAIDNAAEEEELEQDNDGNFHLPNGELYPKNLMERMIETCKKSNDSIGELILRSVFAQRNTIQVQEVEIEEQGENNQTGYQSIYSVTQNIERTQVSLALAEAYQKIPGPLRDSYPGALLSLQKNLQNKGIKFESQIPRESADLIEFLKELSMDLAMVSTFEIAFLIEVPRYPFDLLTGQSYSIMEDGVLPKSPFDLRDLKFSSAGFMIPKDFTFTPVNPIQEETIFNIYYDNSSYVYGRMQTLGLNLQNRGMHFKGEPVRGNNLASTWSKTSAELSALREYVTFILELNDNVNFTREFVSELKQLPRFDQNDPYCKQKWKNFLEEYGTHIVTKANAGGAIWTFLTVRDEELVKLSKGDQPITTIYNQLPFNNDFTRQLNRRMINGLKLEFNFEGGFEPLISTSLDLLNLTEVKDYVDQWKMSLSTRPIQLRKYLKLDPLSDFVKRINNSLGMDMVIATEAFLTGQLDYVVTEQVTNLRSPSEVNSQSSLSKVIPQNEGADSFPEITGLSGAEEDVLKKLHAVLQSQQDQTAAIRRALEKVNIDNANLKLQMVTAMPPPQNSHQTLKISKSESGLYTAKESTNRNPETQQWAWHTVSTTVLPIVTWTTAKTKVYTNQVDDLRCSKDDGCFWETGYGYDAVIGDILGTTPLTSYGDKYCKFFPTIQPNPNTPHYVYKQFGTIEGYLGFRQLQTQSNLKLTSVPKYHKRLLPGYNIQNLESTVIEYRILKNELYKNCEYLSPDFKSLLTALPTYSRASCYAVSKWREVFAKYGTHVVSTSYVGGMIEILPTHNFSDYITKQYPYGGTDVEQYMFFHNIRWDQMEFEMNIEGGDKSILKSNTDLSYEKLTTWSASLRRKGVPLQTDFKVVPIVSLLPTTPALSSYSNAVDDYANGYLGKACNTPSKPCNVHKLVGPRGLTMFDQNCFVAPHTVCSTSFESGVGFTHFCRKNSYCITTHHGITCECEPGFSRKWVPFNWQYECVLRK